jgi:hypothetical protein
MRTIDLKRWKFRYGGLDINTRVRGISIELHSVYAEPKTPYARENAPHYDAFIGYMKGEDGGNGAGFYLHNDDHIAHASGADWNEKGNAWVFQFLLVEDDYESKMNELV